MWDGFVGALIGGIMALTGVWWAFHLQRKTNADILRATLLAELKAARDAFALRDQGDPVVQILDKWNQSGSLADAKWLVPPEIPPSS